MFRRILAALGVALLMVIGGATTAGAADRQPVDGPLSVGVIEGSVRVPEALREGVEGTVSPVHGEAGAWAVTHSDPFVDDSQSGWITRVDVYRVLPYGGSELTPDDRQSICRGEFVGGPEEFPNQDGDGLGAPAVPYPAVDLSTVGWIAEGYAEGYLIPSDEYTGDGSWNPNLVGLMWTPREHMETVRFADTRLGSPREWNSGLEVVVHTYYTPGWDCGDGPFIPETGEPNPEPTPEPVPEPEPTPEPPAVPDVPDSPEEPVDPPVVPEIPEDPAPPVVDEPEEPVEPFFPDTGIEVEESSTPVLGWVLLGLGLTGGLATSVRRWL